jgi:hypothetical protein
MAGRSSTLFVVLVLMILAAGCGASSPTQPSFANVQGEWGGTTCAPNRPVSCAIVLRIEQTETTLSGTWARTTNGGTLTGSVSGNSVILELASSTNPNPSSTMTLTLNGDLMMGSYGTNSVTLSRVR